MNNENTSDIDALQNKLDNIVSQLKEMSTMNPEWDKMIKKYNETSLLICRMSGVINTGDIIFY